MNSLSELRYTLSESFRNEIALKKPGCFLAMQSRLLKTVCWINARIRRLKFVQMNLFRKCDVILINLPKSESLAIFPIGIASIAAYLEKHGVRVLAVDMNSQFIGKKLLSIFIRIKKPKLVGLSAITCQINYAYYVCKYLRAKVPEVNLVYGGVHPSALPEEPFKKGCADFVIVCEGEQTFLELYESLVRNSDFSKVDGLVHKDKKGGIVYNKPREFIKDINNLPMPAYHLFDLYSYIIDIHIYPYNRLLAMDLMTSRGCPHNCSYCSSPFLYRRRVRFRSPEKIADEIEFLIKRYKFKTFHFHDDDFLLDVKRIERLCQILIERKLNIRFIFLTNVNTLLKNLHILPLLKKAGCVGIEFGIESVNKEVLSKMNKSQDTENLLRVAKMMDKEGITPMYLVMSFSPGETLYSSYETTRMIQKLTEGKNINVSYYLQPHHHNFCLGMLTTPYPGSELYKTAKKQGIILAKNYYYYRPENINFIPFSFLEDTPIKIKNLSYEAFSDEIKKYKQAILCHVTAKFNVFPHSFYNRHCLDYCKYVDFLYDLYLLCDGKRNVKAVSGVVLKKSGVSNMGYTCAGLRFLAMFGIISSKSIACLSKQ
ncbi:MAG: radical SAM protein [Nanoarchaeota archaeon]|nr:radical SAM protein [Nanoarchaeota archaeon]